MVMDVPYENDTQIMAGPSTPHYTQVLFPAVGPRQTYVHEPSMENLDPALFEDQGEPPPHSALLDWSERASEGDEDDNGGRDGGTSSGDDGELISEADSDFDIDGLTGLSDMGKVVGTILQESRSQFDGSRGRGRGRTRGGRGRGNRVPVDAEADDLCSSRKHRRNGRSRGQKGVKRGFRKPLDPTANFKRLHSEATAAFIQGNFDYAEDLASQAILENPEIFKAHSLLSEIFLAQGDKARAVIALFNGAHTRPRDTETWAKVAELVLEVADDRQVALLDAVYCYNRIIGVERNNTDARLRRAELNFEAGKTNRAIYDYWLLLGIDPNNLQMMRLLAQCFIAVPAVEKGISYYDKIIAYYKDLETVEAKHFEWTDADIYTELFLISEQFEEGISRLKWVSRWLLGRGDETFWDCYSQDDREFDEDASRRVLVPEYVADSHEAEAYGFGLPLELRIKLGIFRLNLGVEHLDEAQGHFDYLRPDTAVADGTVHDFVDLFRRVGDALRSKLCFKAALRFYEPVSHLQEAADIHFWKQVASCYRELQLWDEAERCYQAIIELQDDHHDARTDVATMFELAGLPGRAKPYREEASARVWRKRSYGSMMQAGQRNGILAASKGEEAADPDFAIQSVEAGEGDIGEIPGLLSREKKRRPQEQHKVGRGGRRVINHDSLRPLFEKMRELKKAYDNGESGAMMEWMIYAKTCIDRFQEVRTFFPYDKHFRFYGYSTKARQRQWLTISEQQKWGEREQEGSEDPNDEDEPEPPDTYALVPFNEWLDCFLQYATFLGQEGQYQRAYSIVEVCIDCIIWYHDAQAMFLTHVVELMIAAMAKDHRRLNDSLRWFMKEYQFVTDTYHLFAALNRVLSRGNVWYNLGPTQKFIMRHVKAMDWSLTSPEEKESKVYEERAAFTTREDNGNPILANDMDIALLMVYGHVLFAGQSYAYSLNYFYRAYALDPTNPMVLLTLALAYIHYGFKRQAENRQTILMQGFSFLYIYHRNRLKSPRAVERQEAEYNVGRAYHLVGLLHLAIPYYERVLSMGEDVRVQDSDSGFGEDFAMEAAFALQNIWLQSGQKEKAWIITQEHLTL